MPNKNKQKGNAYERQVCEFLSETFNLSFRRVPNSGAFIGGKNAWRKEELSANQILLSRGDIIPPDEMSNLVVECKSYNEFPFHHLLMDKDIPLLDSWIAQVTADCDENSYWLIFFKIARKGEFVVANAGKGSLTGTFKYKQNFAISEKKSFFSNNRAIVAHNSMKKQ